MSTASFAAPLETQDASKLSTDNAEKIEHILLSNARIAQRILARSLVEGQPFKVTKISLNNLKQMDHDGGRFCDAEYNLDISTGDKNLALSVSSREQEFCTLVDQQFK